jgi:hypothetical protein
MEQLVQGILDLVNCFVWMVCPIFLFAYFPSNSNFFFQITLGYNKQLYQALRDFVSLTAVFFASYKNTLSKIFAVILVVGRTQFHPLETANDTRPDWIQYDALDGPEWQKVKRCATLAMGMYYWPTYLFLSPRQPLVCTRKLEMTTGITLLKVQTHQF